MSRKAERTRNQFNRIMAGRENGSLRDDHNLPPQDPATPVDRPTGEPTRAAFDRADGLRRKRLEDVRYIFYPAL